MVADVPIRGEVRDAVFDTGSPRSGDGAAVSRDRGWLLTTFALAEIVLHAGGVQVGAGARPRGLGTSAHRLLALGPKHLGVTGWSSKSLAVVERTATAVVKRIPVTAAHLAVTTDDGVRLYAPHGGEAVDVTLPSLRVTGRRPMATGSAPVLHDGELVLLAGERAPVPRVPAERLWRVAPRELLALDAESLEPTARGPLPEGARDVLGVDGAGRVVVSTHTGVALADRRTLGRGARFDLPDLRQALHAHRWLPGPGCVVVYPRRREPHELLVVSWAGASDASMLSAAGPTGAVGSSGAGPRASALSAAGPLRPPSASHR
jgi:hypothetical protein